MRGATAPPYGRPGSYSNSLGQLSQHFLSLFRL